MSINSVLSLQHVPLAKQLLSSDGVGRDNDGDEATESSAQKAAEAAKATALPSDASRGRKVNISS